VDFIIHALQADDDDKEHRRELETAADGFEAGLKVVSFKPHLVVLDLVMPGLDGFKLCEQVKSNSETKHIKILIVTGFGSKENAEQALGLGADGYLLKPLNADELQERVRDLLG